jgi:hypothetical protein
MAIEHRARAALSIAFIASIAAYPNFAPDIFEPMFVAFLLPITAAVIWWLLGRLHGSAVRDAPGSCSCAGLAIWSETPLMFEDEFPDELLQLRL